MREYGGSGSWPTRRISSRGACLCMVSAAITPAGPLPRITCFMAAPRIQQSDERSFRIFFQDRRLRTDSFSSVGNRRSARTASCPRKCDRRTSISAALRCAPTTFSARTKSIRTENAVMDKYRDVLASKSQPRLGLLRQAAFLVPAAHLVVFRQHFVQAVDQPFRRAGFCGLCGQPFGQGIVLAGKTGAIVEFPFH